MAFSTNKIKLYYVKSNFEFSFIVLLLFYLLHNFIYKSREPKVDLFSQNKQKFIPYSGLLWYCQSILIKIHPSMCKYHAFTQLLKCAINKVIEVLNRF